MLAPWHVTCLLKDELELMQGWRRAGQLQAAGPLAASSIGLLSSYMSTWSRNAGALISNENQSSMC